MRGGWLNSRQVLGLFLLLSHGGRTLYGQAGGAPGSQLVLSGGTIYVSPSADPIRNGVVVIRDGKVAAVGRRGTVPVPKGVPALDCSGLVVTAGFWNSHVHLMERKWGNAANLPPGELAIQMQVMLTRYGYTSVFDLGSPLENTMRIRQRIESGEIAGPRIRSTGEGLIGKGWLPSDAILGVLGFLLSPLPEVGDGTSALAAARKVLDGGADGIKLFTASSFPPYTALPAAAIQTAVEEAHRRNKPVFAHPSSGEGLLAAVRGGVDIIAHTTPQSGDWDESVLTAMQQAQIALIPTLKVWQYQLRHDRASLSDARAHTSVGQLRAWLGRGGTVLFGTDVGGIDDYDPGEEYALMAAAGMTFRQILASLTTVPATRFREAGRLGRIAPGMTADLVVLQQDPSRDMRAFAGVRYTLRDGQVIYPGK